MPRLFGESVPREMYDRECTRADRLEQRVAELTSQMLAMQRDGWRPAPPAATASDEPELPQEITKAIAAMASATDSRLARDLTRYAAAMLQAGSDPADIVEAIRNGGE